MKLSLGCLICEKRQSLALSQKDLADKMGVAVEVISRWEHNKNVPSARNLRKLAKIFKVDIEELTALI